MKVILRGNFQPDLPDELRPAWSTETHLSASLELLGHDVVRLQEDRVEWDATVKACVDADLFVWTATRDFSLRWDQDHARRAVAELNAMLPTAGVHLDRWWGLNREPQLREDVYWRLGWHFTADGDSDDRWPEVNVRHRWMPPAVYGPECVPGTFRADWASDVAFIGSWPAYAHNEWAPERRRMLAYARERYGNAFVCWPRAGHGAVRSQNLNDLLASVRVVLGDSCMATTSSRYWSDRVPETIGRGGFLVMQAIPGLVEQIPEGSGVTYYPPGDLAAMCERVDYYLAHEDERRAAIERGQAHVRDHHTYAHRMRSVLDTLRAEGAFGS